MKYNNFRSFLKNLLKIKPCLTLGSILLNALIFSYSAANISCVRWIMNAFQDGIQGKGILHRIWPYFILLGGNAAVRWLSIRGSSYLDVLRRYYYHDSLRIQVFRGLLHSNHLRDRADNSGKTFERLDDDVPAACFPVELVTEVAGYCIFTFIAVGSLMLINWRITLFLFLPLSLCLFLIKKISGRIRSSRKQNRDMHDRTSSLLSDIVTSVLSIKTMDAKDPVLEKYDNVIQQRTRAVVKDSLFQNSVSATVDIASVLCIVIMMAAVTGLMQNGSFPLGDFAIFICYLDTLNNCILRIIELYTETKKAEVSYQRILETAEEQNSLCLGMDGKLLPPLSPKPEPVSADYGELPAHPGIFPGEEGPEESYGRLKQLSVNGLSCIYEDGRGIRDVTFQLSAGELLVLTGPVASGKSSILNALLGIVPASFLEILWNGKEVRNLFTRFKAPHVSCCLQSSHLLNGTVRENLTLGRNISEPECWKALRLACMEEEVMEWPGGLDTMTGENGIMLSGGQKQRLLLTRMLLEHPSLYFLDDATSALDRITAEKIIFNLKQRMIQDNAAAVFISNSEVVKAAADRELCISQYA